MYLVMSSAEVISNWNNIKCDPLVNSDPDMKTPYEFIHYARQGKVYVDGIQIIISNKLPEFE